MTEATPPLAYPVPRAADLLGISRSTLYTEIQRGRLRPIKIRGRTLLAAAELERYLAALQAEAER